MSAASFDMHPEKSDALMGGQREGWKHEQVSDEVNKAKCE